jgi:hypothetical protein
MEPSWHVVGPEPAPLRPGTGPGTKTFAYKSRQRFSSQIIRSPTVPSLSAMRKQTEISSFIKCPRFMRLYGKAGRNLSMLSAVLR